jgi:PAS domain S-box-containing protein
MGSAAQDKSKNHAVRIWNALLGFQHSDPLSPFQSLIEQALPEALFVHDQEGRFMAVNDRACESVGYSRAELLNLSVFDIEQDFDLASAQAQWRTMQPGVRMVVTGTHRRRDGSRFPVEVHFGVLDSGGHRCYLCIACDISERMQAQRDLLEREAELVRARDAAQAADAAKSAFLANMSHEFRTPLHAIVGMSQLIRLEGNLSGKQQQWLNMLDASCQRLGEMVRAILELSQLESGTWHPVPEPVEVPAMMERLHGRLMADAVPRPLCVRREVGAMPAPLRLDGRMVERALQLLAENAVKFTPHGSVTLRAKVDREEEHCVVLRFEVQDTGMGLEPEVAATLFSPFTQGDASPTRKFGGIGVGLVTVRRIAHRLGGEAGVRSTPGSGSTFWFTARAQRMA